MYEKGTGVATDIEKAREWYGKAAGNGDANTYLRCRIVRCPPEQDLFPRGLMRLRSGNNGARKPLPADSHYDISITDNRVDGPGISVEGCTGGEVRRNGDAKVRLRNCAAVQVDEPTRLGK